MKDVIDVAAYVLRKVDSVSTMKLQKLVFYSQAYSLVKYRIPLFGNEIQAWANGPVVPDLFDAHRHKFVVTLDSMDFCRPPIELSNLEKSIVDYVVGRIGGLSGSDLSAMTHSEAPWLDARVGLSDRERSNRVITIKAIQDYYSSPNCSNIIFKVA